MSEDQERAMPEGETGQREEEDVEAHQHIGAPADKTIGATEEGPDVEGHSFQPKAHPKATP